MICADCKGNGCEICHHTGQIKSIFDQTYIIVKKNGQKVDIIAVQGNWRKETITSVDPQKKESIFEVIEKIRYQPNIKISQVRSELSNFFKLGVNKSNA